MKTNVTQTSIVAYHSHRSKNTQVLRVADYCLKETKAGRPVWIRKIAEHFAIHSQPDLAQISTASARFKEIKENGVIIQGEKYRLEYVRTERPANGRCAVEMYALVIDRPSTNQPELF